MTGPEKAKQPTASPPGGADIFTQATPAGAHPPTPGLATPWGSGGGGTLFNFTSAAAPATATAPSFAEIVAKQKMTHRGNTEESSEDEDGNDPDAEYVELGDILKVADGGEGKNNPPTKGSSHLEEVVCSMGEMVVDWVAVGMWEEVQQ